MDTNPHDEREKCEQEEGVKEKLEPKDGDMEMELESHHEDSTADKHKNDAKQQSTEPELPHDDDDTDTLKDYESDDEISLGSNPAALLESDCQAESQTGNQVDEIGSTTERTKRRCNQWTPGSYKENRKLKRLQDKTHLTPEKRHEEKHKQTETLKLKSMSWQSK